MGEGVLLKYLIGKIPVSFWKEAVSRITQTGFGTILFCYNLRVVVKTR